jgi:hypothetical protein
MSSYFCSVASKVSVVYDILELKKCSCRKYNVENDTWKLKVKNFAGNHVIIWTTTSISHVIDNQQKMLISICLSRQTAIAILSLNLNDKL